VLQSSASRPVSPPNLGSGTILRRLECIAEALAGLNQKLEAHRDQIDRQPREVSKPQQPASELSTMQALLQVVEEQITRAHDHMISILEQF